MTVWLLAAELGANTLAKNKDGFTPLMAARDEGHAMAVNALEEVMGDLKLR